jgi:signal transduction histidine kinase
MANLLATLIDSSRAAVGRLDVAPERTDLLVLVESVVADHEAEVVDRVRIEVRPGFDPAGEWDPFRLHQLFANLLSNAQKYSPPERPIEISLAGDEQWVRVSVRDYGLGIAAADLGRLFQRYVRTRSAQASQAGGLGLGLYLSQAIAQAHGGRIWVESDGPGCGSTFHLELPRRPGSSDATG